MASDSPDPTSRNIHARGYRELQAAAKTRGRSSDQAPLHDPGGREDPPARDPQGQEEAPVCRSIEEARSYSARRGESAIRIRPSDVCSLTFDLWLYGDAYVDTDGKRIDPRYVVRPHGPVELHPRRRG
jgi:hypothetical protein